jgi:sigma-B regulation protein RsbU (phosphoserine phosphatase)
LPRTTGDFYDVFPAGADTWWAVIGDVCGKGVEAAALTAAVRYALRTAAVLTASPAQVLSIVNETLLHDDWDDRFATLALVVLDLRTDGVTVTFASGGHPKPLVRRADGSVERLAVDGMIVGTLREAEFTEATTRLAPGDCLVLYTDGATEAGRTSDLFGESRLSSTVSCAPATTAASVVQAVADAVDQFAAGADDAGADHGLDDLALLAFLVR